MLKKKNRVYTTIFLVIWTILLVLIPLGISFIEKNNFKNNMSYISSEFNIEDYNIVLDVDKDNKIDVTEKFIVNIFKSFCTLLAFSRFLNLLSR